MKDAYFAFAETLGRKPSQADLNESEYKAGVYIRVFGSWIAFLREVGEYTEASFHYPQGTHLGHILSILKVFGSGSSAGTQFDDRFIRLRGGLGEGRLGTYQRQVKYKIQAAMELGVLPDDRNFAKDETYSLELTPLGRELYDAFRPMLDRFDLDFPRDADGIPSTRMRDNEEVYNSAIRDHIRANAGAREVAYRVFLKMHAVRQMLAFLYHVIRLPEVERSTIYNQFFQAPFVKQFCDQEGIDEATPAAALRRCPFLLNILVACDVIDTERTKVTVKKLLLLPSLVRPYQREDAKTTSARLRAVAAALPASPEHLDDENLSIVRELFGGTFLTSGYYLTEFETIEE